MQFAQELHGVLALFGSYGTGKTHLLAAIANRLRLDDVDKLKPSEFREATLYHLIDKRTSAGRALALSLNCTPYELDRFIGEAARSRLMMGLVPVQITGTDFRIDLQRKETANHIKQEKGGVSTQRSL
jgi:DNA replication protein DnaC